MKVEEIIEQLQSWGCEDKENRYAILLTGSREGDDANIVGLTIGKGGNIVDMLSEALASNEEFTQLFDKAVQLAALKCMKRAFDDADKSDEDPAKIVDDFLSNNGFK